jgi:hypothetical protein
MGIDKNGDLWLLDYSGRFGGVAASHFTGHIPPAGGWSYDHYYSSQIPPQFNMDVTDCQSWPAVDSQWFQYSYQSSSECEALQAARAPRNVLTNVFPAFTTIDQDGSIWWVTSSGFWDALTFELHHLLDNGVNDQKLPTAHIQNTTVIQDLAGAQVTAVAPDPNHGVWLGTTRGLLYSDGATVREVPLAQDQHTLRAGPRNIAIDTEGTVWIITAQGVQKLLMHNSQWQEVYDFGLGRPLNDWALGTIAAAHEGGIWATHGQDLWRFG